MIEALALAAGAAGVGWGLWCDRRSRRWHRRQLVALVRLDYVERELARERRRALLAQAGLARQQMTQAEHDAELREALALALQLDGLALWRDHQSDFARLRSQLSEPPQAF